ncbi:MAG TPA: rhomboid family intramembrane serine protease [Spirochaetota bacterium]|nr:rhomboid family intramembrane serine protease [Spirochaetota bacterium]HOS32911.1 rhomboid family intramembrane serine protease [Spirochaetota bacterium]HOS56097.1 rhomboid family intramembrane serine protease [Spirochaetota bacterium]HPK62298.1 rhomboid family intramembrane serine protease [Spirochaetota bacterium]HQF76814.1 rhomboid family intramembrane serine protease [Spirochaetota bacterium]
MLDQTALDNLIKQNMTLILIISSIIGIIPALIAKKKGRNFFLWWIYGFMMFIVALIHSLLIKPLYQSSDSGTPAQERELPKFDGKQFFTGIKRKPLSDHKNYNLSLIFIIVMVTMYIFNKMSATAFMKLFVIHSPDFFHIFPWRFITYVFYFPENIFFFFFTVLIFFMFSTNLENLWGSFHYSLFLIITIVGKSLAVFLFGGNFPLADNMALYTVLMVAFGFNYPDQTIYLFFAIPIRIKVLAIISLAIAGVQIIVNSLFPILDNFQSGIIKIHPNLALFLSNILSYVSILIYFKKIFGEETFRKIFNSVKTHKSDIEYQRNIKSIKSMNLDETKQSDDLEKNLIGNNCDNLNSAYSKDLIMCPEEDFEQNSEYCLTCRNYKKCLDRNLKISN